MDFRPPAALVTVLLALLAPAVASAAAGDTVARAASAGVDHARTFKAPLMPTHIALHWRGNRDARVRVAFRAQDGRFRRPQRVELDDAGEQRPGRETWGAVMVARKVTAVRVYSDRPLSRLTVLWLQDRGARVHERPLARSASYAQPAVLRRADWGADESLRFDSSGNEIWPSAYYPVQKLLVHHTATQNNDPDPPATVRSIYYYHAVTQGWGDIGYNFLIDESGRIYEGRHTIDYPPGGDPTEENASGYVVTGAHATNFNSGVVGIALLGTLTNQDATPAARQALEQLLAWESDHHGLDPQGTGLYTNPVNGTQKTFPNIAGHRDVAATECPGGVFYATLPSIRSDVAAMLGAGTPAFSLTASPSSVSVGRGQTATYTLTITPTGGFTGDVTLSVAGNPAATTTTLVPNPVTISSTASVTSKLTVTTSRSTPTGTSTLTVTAAGGGVTRQANVTLQVKRKPPPAS
jgi:N-acetylmuramoyl-L-alanine amidase